MPDYRIELDVYHGPLDLLLYLIKRNEVDIHNIPIAPIAEQYMEFLGRLERLDINLAGEFLVMAATLMEIKSATLAPAPAEDPDQADDLAASEDPADPRYELIQQLLAYKRYKDAAHRLDDRRDAFSERFAAAPPAQDADLARRVELDLDDVSMWDLVEAFGRMMEQVGLAAAHHEVVADDTPIELHAADLVDRLERDGPMTLQQIFAGREQGEMIGLFLAMLELVRQRRLLVHQEQRAGEIHIELTDAPAPTDPAEDDAPDRAAPDPANPDDFDWPDEQTRQRYIRRQQRRARGEFVEEDAELEADIAELEAQGGQDDQQHHDQQP
jgi:segregation and condensation protein A